MSSANATSISCSAAQRRTARRLERPLTAAPYKRALDDLELAVLERRTIKRLPPCNAAIVQRSSDRAIGKQRTLLQSIQK